ncbi:MAG: hypothetical protein R3335_11540, partial [Anaerolineales bacterium]|nr:hypothetical protein [Anaerolineales bacterium]
PQVKQLARELGFGDLGLPEDLDEAQVILTVQPSVMSAYGQCRFDEIFDEHGDPTEVRFDDCLVLAQSPSPTIEAPDSLNLPEIGQTFLQVMGLTPEEASEFSRTVDWTSTLVIPIPRYGSSYETVMVDGVEGTLISQEFSSHQPNFLLIWVRDGIVYSITGDGAGGEGIALANSLR